MGYQVCLRIPGVVAASKYPDFLRRMCSKYLANLPLWVRPYQPLTISRYTHPLWAKVCRLYSSINSDGISLILILAYSDLSIEVARLKFHVKAGKLCAMEGDETVYNDLGKLEGSSGGCYIIWVNNCVATDGDYRPFWVVLVGEYLAYYFFVRNLFYSLFRYIFISNDLECFSYFYLFF